MKILETKFGSVVRYEKVTHLKMPSKLINGKNLSELCELSSLKNFFVVIYNIEKESLDLLAKDLPDKNYTLTVNSQGGFVFCLQTSNSLLFLTKLLKLDFGEICIWNCYTSLDKFAQAKPNSQTSTPNDIQKNSVDFYFTYNKYENNFAELYLAPSFGSILFPQ